MEDGENAPVHRLVQVNQNVAAANEVQVRKRSVAGQILAGEYAAFANILADLIATIDLFEETIQPGARHVLSDDLPIDAGARSLQSEVDDVRAKDLNSHGVAEHRQQLMHEDRNR